MHELSLGKNILALVLDNSNGFSRVTQLLLEVGQLTAIDTPSLLMGFELLAKGTLAEGAQVECIMLSGQAWCADCQKTVPLHQYGEPCCDCGGYSLEVTQGEGLHLKSMVVE